MIEAKTPCNPRFFPYEPYKCPPPSFTNLRLQIFFLLYGNPEVTLDIRTMSMTSTNYLLASTTSKPADHPVHHHSRDLLRLFTSPPSNPFHCSPQCFIPDDRFQIFFTFHSHDNNGGGVSMSLLLNLMPKSCWESAYEPMVRRLRDFRMEGGEQGRRRMIEFAIGKAKDAVKDAHPSVRVVYLTIYFEVLTMTIPVTPSRDPADDRAVELLASKRVSSSTESFESCTICLEEFGDGQEALWMPCSHVFHGDCIRKWLKKSHYCPMCRFELPTSK